MREKQEREREREREGENPAGGSGKVREQLKGEVGGDGNMCVGVFYTSARGRMEVRRRGMGPGVIQSTHE